MGGTTPLLFLPGAGGSAAFWRPVADRLRDLGPAHLVGWPGFAGAPADPAVASLDDLLRWLLPRLPAGRCHVVAQSMGGILAARLAAEWPRRVDRLVLAATSGGVDVAALGGADWRAEFRRGNPAVPRWFEEDRTDLGERLGAIRAPTLLLWSDADPVSPLAVGRHLAARIPGARLALVPGGSHSFAAERPDEVAALVRAHLAQDRAMGPTTLYLLGALCLAAGLAGVVLPAVPGAVLLALGAVLVGWAGDFARLSVFTVGVCVALSLAIWVVDLAAAALGAKVFGASRWAMVGSVVGLCVGLFLGLPGVVLGPALGALAFEYARDPNLEAAVRAGVGTLVGFVLGTAVKSALALTIVGVVALALVL